MADLEKNRTFPTRYMEEIFNQRKYDVIDQLFAPALAGRVRGMTEGFLAGFPDWHGKVESIVTEGDMVVNRWTGHGTHAAPFMGIAPTGKNVHLEGITIFRIAGDKVVEEWSQADQLGFMQQLGVIPSQG